MDGERKGDISTSFADIEGNAWYADAVVWAAERNIVTGCGNGSFVPNELITRKQLTVILWRYAQAKGQDLSVGKDTNILSYTDIDRADKWAISALQAVGSGVLDPQGQAIRAEVATMLVRFCELKKQTPRFNEGAAQLCRSSFCPAKMCPAVGRISG